jgi:antitoxin PrlF
METMHIRCAGFSAAVDAYARDDAELWFVSLLVKPAIRCGCYAYKKRQVRSAPMEITATLSSKGQITVPREVREALSLQKGDRVVFRVEGSRAVMARTPDLLALAGSISVPAAKRGTPWDEVRRQTRRARAAARR